MRRSLPFFAFCGSLAFCGSRPVPTGRGPWSRGARMERLERLDQRFPHAFFGPTPLLLAALATQTLAAWVACVALLAFGLGSFYGGLAGWGDFTKLTKSSGRMAVGERRTDEWGKGQRSLSSMHIHPPGGMVGLRCPKLQAFDMEPLPPKDEFYQLVIFLMPSLCRLDEQVDLSKNSFVCVYLSSHLPPPGPAISTISLICAALCVACAVPLKALSDRRRPAVRWGQEAQRATLLAPYIKAMCKGGQSREAWPSSDAAVMAANAILLWNVLKTSSLSSSLAVALSVSVFALACFGRMYFWAHHLFDVLSGGLLGSLIVLGALHFRWCSSWHFLLSFVLFLLSVAFMQKRTRIFDQPSETKV
ncbi:NFX1-type zinc finger-containing protein 1 [Durusdinium trenchii]|uniref:NFX1-type zinc finger-containing protein 1 n=1 Tax=Durusdinium trenchii TaxID=1381693 RepID=A0ABP0PJR0_9DINO